jgi:hypothetical protein
MVKLIKGLSAQGQPKKNSELGPELSFISTVDQFHRTLYIEPAAVIDLLSCSRWRAGEVRRMRRDVEIICDRFQL